MALSAAPGPLWSRTRTPRILKQASEPENEDHHHAPGDTHESGGDGRPHRDFVRFVHRGSLSGPIAGASLVFDPQGKLTDVSAPLSINQATLEFSGVQGTGSATFAGLTLVF